MIETEGLTHIHLVVRDLDRSLRFYRQSLDDAIAEAERAGGRLVERGEHAPGIGFAYVADPDGYLIEL